MVDRAYGPTAAPSPDRLTCTDLPWNCARCGKLLGYLDPDTRTHLRIKQGAFFLYVFEAKLVAHPCRNCGHINELSTNPADPARA